MAGATAPAAAQPVAAPQPAMLPRPPARTERRPPSRAAGPRTAIPTSCPSARSRAGRARPRRPSGRWCGGPRSATAGPRPRPTEPASRRPQGARRQAPPRRRGGGRGGGGAEAGQPATGDAGRGHPGRALRARRRDRQGPPRARAQGPARRSLPDDGVGAAHRHPDRRARGPQPDRALRVPAGRRRHPDPRQHLPRAGPERAARHGGGVRRHRHAQERRALPRRRPVRGRGHRGEGRQPAHRAAAQGQADDHLPGHQEPDRPQGRPPHPGGVASPAGSWC